MLARRSVSSVKKTKYPWYYGKPCASEYLQTILSSKGVQTEKDVNIKGISYTAKCGTTLVQCCVDNIEPEFALSCVKCAERNGYSCICVFDWDDPFKVAAMLQQKTSVYARKCSVELIEQKTANAFLKLYHLQGAAKGQTCCLGMYYKGELLAVMTFGKPRYNRKYEWELIRLCFHPKYAVSGASDRMFKHFVKLKQPKSIISYCDYAKFKGNVYYRLGMTLVSLGAPSKHWYSATGKERSPHITNNFLLQRGYDQIFCEHYGKGTSNEELITARGYTPMYDAGQMTFEWYSN